MKSLRAVRIVAWAAIGVAAFLLGGVTSGWMVTDGPLAPTGSRKSEQAIGGPFEMTDHRGRRFTEADLRGRTTLLFFGFTSCPDVCPTALSEMSSWMEDLGPAGDSVQAVFVSVDPERDDVAQMAAYLEPFDSRIIGLTGTPAQLAQMAGNFRIYYRKVAIDGGDYTMDHTASVYLLDRSSGFAGLLEIHAAREASLDKIKRVAATIPAEAASKR